MANKIYENYFGTKSQFDPNDTQLGDNSYQVNGIKVGLNNGRNSVGVQKNWIAKKNLARANQGLVALNTTFNQNFKDFKSAQNYINQMLKQASIRTGADFGSIIEDGKWGDQTQQALDLVSKIYQDGGNDWGSQTSKEGLVDAARVDTLPPTTPTTPTALTPGLNKVNRAVVREGLSNVKGTLNNQGYIGISNTDQLKQAMFDPNNQGFLKDLYIKYRNRGYSDSDDDWSRFLQDAKISGGIGAKDRKDLRNWYNSNDYIIKKQQGGKMNEEGQIKQAFAEFCKANNLQPNEESWAKFQQYLEQMAQQQTQMAKLGAKLNYIKNIKGECPEGTEKYYFKAGGRICSACRGVKAAEEGMEIQPKGNKKAISSTVQNYRNSQASATTSVYSKIDSKRHEELTSKRAKSKLTPQEEQEYKRLTSKFRNQSKSVQSKYSTDMDKCGGKMKKHFNGGAIDLVKLRSLLNLNK